MSIKDIAGISFACACSLWSTALHDRSINGANVMASWCHDGSEPKRNNTGECSDGNDVSSFPCCR
jgi:hypothetical protein